MSAPTPFGRYQLHGVLGSGGMAVVYRASVEGPHGFRRELVVKRMLPGFFTDPRNVRMMAAEARVLSKLTHPCIVQLFEFGEVAGEYFLAMEYVDGADLSTLLAQARARGTRLDVDVGCFLGQQLASALAAVHELRDEHGAPLGVVHRDVTPSNVMVSATGAVKLLDFGIALIAAQPGLEVDKTKTNFVKGKLTYVAPEQLEGARPDARSDLYSLGVLLYESFTGQRLFAAGTDLEVLAKRQALLRVPRLSAAGVQVPAEVDELIATLLEPRPDERTVSARDAERVLTRFVSPTAPARLAQAVTQTRQATRATPAPTDEQLAEPIDLSLTRPDRPLVRADAPSSKRRWPGRLALALIGASALIVGGFVITREVPQEVAPAPAAPQLESPPDVPPLVASPPSEVRPVIVPAPPPTIRLAVKGTAGAQVELDGRVLGTVPLAIELPASTGHGTLRISRGGFAAAVRTLELDRDIELELPLKKLPPQKKVPSSGKKGFADPFR